MTIRPEPLHCVPERSSWLGWSRPQNAVAKSGTRRMWTKLAAGMADPVLPDESRISAPDAAAIPEQATPATSSLRVRVRTCIRIPGDGAGRGSGCNRIGRRDRPEPRHRLPISIRTTQAEWHSPSPDSRRDWDADDLPNRKRAGSGPGPTGHASPDRSPRLCRNSPASGSRR